MGWDWEGQDVYSGRAGGKAAAQHELRTRIKRAQAHYPG
jgi:hypothetical protein